MPFVTKVDYSDNRQVKQFQLTNTKLSGTTVFGTDYSGLTNGVDVDTVVVTGTYSNIISTFSGNPTTTTFFFGQPEMVSGIETLEPITNVNSGDTQVGIGYQGINPVNIDGNDVYSSYTGSTFDLTVTSIEEIGVDEWTGITNSTTVTLLSGDSADFTGRTIWVDVKGITRTKRLILTDELDDGGVDSVILGRDTDGNIVALSGTTGVGSDDYTTGTTLSGTVLEFTRLSGGTYNIDLSSLVSSGGNGNDYVNSATFNTGTGDLTLTRLSGGTVVENLDGRYLTGFTDNDDYTTGTTLSGTILEFTRLSGGTFNVELSGLTSGGTANTDDYTTGVTQTGNNLEFTRLSGGTYNIELSGITGSTDTIITDNYVAVGTGSGIEGTSGLTFNGSELEVIGDVIANSVSVADGSITLPSIDFSGSTNPTGIYLLRDNTIGFGLNNGVRYAMDSSFMGSEATYGPRMTSASSLTAPTFLFKSDTDTGIGRSAEDEVTTYAGGLPITTVRTDSLLVNGGTYSQILNAERNYSYVHNPLGGQWSQGTGTENGYFIIQSPIEVGNDYTNYVFTVEISGQYDSPLQLYISAQWFVTSFGTINVYSTSAEGYNFTVQAGHNGTNIYFLVGDSGTTWNRQTFKIKDVSIGYVFTDIDTIKDGWVLDIDAAVPSGFTASKTKTSVDLLNSTIGFEKIATTNLTNDGWHTIAQGKNTLSYAGTILMDRGDQSSVEFTFSQSYSNTFLKLNKAVQLRDTTVQGIRLTADEEIQVKLGDGSYSGAWKIVLLNSDGNINLTSVTATGSEIISKEIEFLAEASGEIHAQEVTVNSTVFSENLNLNSLTNTFEGLTEFDVISQETHLKVLDYSQLNLGPEIITDPDFNTPGDWVIGDPINSEIIGGEFSVSATTGTTLITTSTLVTPFSASTLYYVELEISELAVSGGLQVYLGNNAWDYGFVNVTGTTSYIMSATAPWDNVSIRRGGTQWDGGKITRLSVKEILPESSTTILNTTYDDSITGMTVTGSLTKTITLEQRDGSTITADFTDNTGGGGSGDVVTGMTFNTGDGVLTLSTLSGDTITEDLDGRYLTGFTETPNTDDYTTGTTLSGSLLEFTRLSGGTYNVDLSGLTGTTIIAPINEIIYGTGTGTTSSSGLTFNSVESKLSLVGYGSLNPSPSTGSFVVSGETGKNIRLTVDAYPQHVGVNVGSTGVSAIYQGVDTSGDGMIQIRGELAQSGVDVNENVSFIVNGGGLEVLTSIGNMAFDGGNFYVNQAGGDYDFKVESVGDANLIRTNAATNRVGIGISPTQEKLHVNGNIFADGYVVSGGTNDDILLGDGTLTSLSGLTSGFVTGNTVNTDDYITGGTFNTGTGDLDLNLQSGSTVTVNLDDRYLTGFTIPSTYLESGDNISELVNNVGYITGFTDTNNVVTGMTFNTGDGVLTLSTLSGDTITEDLDGRYSLTGHTHDISDITGFIDNSTNWDIAYDDSITGMTVTGSATKTITLEQRDGSTITADFTDNTGGVGGSGDVVTGMTFNTGDGVLTLSTLSGDTITEDLDGRYLTGFTETPNTDDYITGSTFNTGTGDLTLTRLSGGTVVENLDGRYSLTGHTHDISDITGFTDNSTNWNIAYDDSITGMTVTGSVTKTITLEQRDGSTITADFTDNTGDVVTGMTFNTGDGVLTLSTLSGDTITEDLDGRYGDVFLTGTPVANEVAIWTSDNTIEGDSGFFLENDSTFRRLNIGIDDTTAGFINLFGHSTSSANAGIRIYTNATDDTNVDYWEMKPWDAGVSGNLRIGGAGLSAESLVFSDINGAITSPVTEISHIDTLGDKALITKEYLAGFVTGFTTGNTVNTDDYITGGTFNTGTGDLTLTRLSGGTVVENLDGRYLTVHPAISAAASSDNSGRTYIQDLLFDEFGHVTGVTTSTETVVDTTYTNGAGLDLVGTVFSHTDTSTQTSSNNSGRTYIQDILLDTYGHITGLTTSTETVVNTDTQLTTEQVQDITGGMFIGNTETLITATYQDGDGTIDLVVENDLSLYDNSTSGFITGFTDTTYTNGDGLDLVGNIFSHTDTSTQVSSNNSGRTYIQDILLDTYGHITGLTTSTETVVNTNQLTTFTLTADSGTPQTIAHSNTMDIAGGTGISTVVGATDTVTVNLNAATTTVRGGIELEDAAVQTTAANTVTTTASRTYGLQVNAAGQGVINVPWTNTQNTYTATLTAGTGLAGTTYNPSTSTTFSLDFSELSVGGTLIATDYLIAENGGVENRQLISSIPLSIFDNDSSWTSNAGTVTSVTAGAGMTQTGTSTINPTLNVIGGTGITANANDIQLDYTGTNNFIDSATNLEGTPIASADTIIYHDATDNNVKKGFVSDLPFATTGDLSGYLLNTTDTLTGILTVTGNIVSGGNLLLNDNKGVYFDSDSDVFSFILNDASNTYLKGVSVNIYGGGNGKQHHFIEGETTDYAPIFASSFKGETTAISYFNGNVAIGKETANAELEVAAVTGTTIRVTSTKNGTWAAEEELGALEFYGSDISGVGVGVKGSIRMLATDTFGSAHQMAFYTCIGTKAEAEAMRIDESQRVGIGTKNPSSLLHLSSGTGGFGNCILTIEADTDNTTENSNPQILLKQDGGGVTTTVGIVGDAGTQFTNSLLNASYIGNDSAYALQLYTNGDAKMTIESGGDVGIGITNPTSKLHVVGTGLFTSTVTATNFILSSDKLLKDNITNINENDRIDVDWKTFELKSEVGVKRYGVIAQELEEKHPEFVRTHVDGNKSVAYIDLLIAKIAELEERLKKAGI